MTILRSFADLPRDWVVRYSDDQPRDEDGRWTSEGGGGSSAGPEPTGIAETPSEPAHASKIKESPSKGTAYEFVSPSVASHLSFDEAVGNIDGAQQNALHEASLYINGALGLHSREFDIVGAWADGAENSVMDIVDRADWNKLTLSGAMKGWLADQKQVLIFQQQDGGSASLFKFEATGDLADIHKGLLEDGLGFHTLVPHEGGATVYVADLDGTAAEAVEKGSARYDADVQVEHGKARFLGTEDQAGSDRQQRDSARASYEADIRKSPILGSAEVWKRVRDRWGQGLSAGAAAHAEPGVYASNAKDTERVKKSWIASSAIKTREDLYTNADENKRSLDSAGFAIAAKTGAKYKAPGLKKNDDRVTEKLKTRSPAGLSDIVRSTFVVTSPEQADAVVAQLGKVFPIVDEGWKVTKAGYTDRAVNVRFDNGQLGEVLIMSPEMEWAKSPDGGRGHDMYVEYRDPMVSPERKAELEQQQLALYGDAIKKQPEVWQSVKPVPI